MFDRRSFALVPHESVRLNCRFSLTSDAWAWKRWKDALAGPEEVKEPIRTMSPMIPTRGPPRIAGELAKIGISATKSTVDEYRVRKGQTVNAEERHAIPIETSGASHGAKPRMASGYGSLDRCFYSSFRCGGMRML